MIPITAAVLLLLCAQEPPAKVDFARDVQPILQTSCIKCHGAEKPKGRLRLDAKGPAMKGGVSGKAILPGKGAESPLIKVLLAADLDERMPRKAEPLSTRQIDLLRAWIDQGADWPGPDGEVAPAHWAYVKPVRPAVPTGKAASPIDAFVLARLEKEGLKLAPEAPRETLIRRVSLDLVGLPPTLDDVDAFVADRRPDAYEKLVERLLASPHYGERWARPWLDLARYADTNGFNFDTRRTMWKYRDWVIDALNRDLPFDRFTIEQMAGDLLPDATLEQKIATGFHRNTMTNEEGGTDPAEARWETLLDRVNTTGAVWLGSTLGCAQCHSHKYDPFSQKEYYQLVAFFESCDEPRIELLTPEQLAERKELRARIGREEKALREKSLPVHVSKALAIAIEKRSDTQRNDVVVFCRSQAPAALHPLTQPLLDLYAELETFNVGTALVLQEKTLGGPPSTDFHIKGGYANKGERVVAGVPASLPPLPAGKPVNRLGLAYWLIDRENPLTARVVVNRFWGEFFGRPIVETPEDFGTQGAAPSHPELLEWLAVEFMDRGWSMKSLHRTIVLSSTYRQSSRMTPAQFERDPYNRLLARGPRFRMEAEMIRDAMLSAAGLLSPKIGGPSVFPLQADTSGVVAINKVDTAWKPSPGEDRYRRGLYTHWRRTAPFASLAIFDAPSREICTVKRPRTNTPLQALTALNDPAFFDAARGLARRVLAEGPPDDRGRLAFAFRLCTARPPSAAELRILEKALVAEPEPIRWTLMANVLLSLDESMTKE